MKYKPNQKVTITMTATQADAVLTLLEASYPSTEREAAISYVKFALRYAELETTTAYAIKSDDYDTYATDTEAGPTHRKSDAKVWKTRNGAVNAATRLGYSSCASIIEIEVLA